MKIAVYGDLNLNYMDGSAIWAVSVVQTLAGIKGLEVIFYLKAAIAEPQTIAPLYQLANVTIVPPPRNNKRPLTPAEALDQIERDDAQQKYIGVLLRGYDLNRQAADRESLAGRLWVYLTDVPQQVAEMNERAVTDLNAICKTARYLLCQTLQFKEHFDQFFPQAREKTRILPPMIPDVDTPLTQAAQLAPGEPFKVVYAGKFAPLWASREMLAIFKKTRARYADIELHIFGDKIHNPPEDPDFKPALLEELANTAGVVWHKAVKRKTVLAALPTMTVGWAWRHPALEQSTLELSTKVLEYSACGLASIMAQNPVVMSVFGPDYPLYANSEEDALAKLELAIREPQVLAQAAAIARQAAQSFGFQHVRTSFVEPLIAELPGAHSRLSKKQVLGVVGHDLKFIDLLTQRFEQEYDCVRHYWWGHKHHDVFASEELVSQADIIFCEWCLGNAVWHARHKRKNQKLFVRFHAQEINTDFPAELNLDEIEGMIFVGRTTMKDAIEKFDWAPYREKFHVIPNCVDTANLLREKLPGNAFNLGIVGISPQQKRLDLALDVLEGLRRVDPRYQLFIKGKLPHEYDWLKTRESELAYYELQLRRIEKSAFLRDAVHFDGWGNDMGEWYKKIGYVLSVSDFESFHLSVAEGGASGAIPLLRDWPGAAEIYPLEWITPSVDGMVKKVLAFAGNPQARQTERTRVVEHVKTEFDISVINERYLELFGKSSM